MTQPMHCVDWHNGHGLHFSMQIVQSLDFPIYLVVALFKNIDRTSEGFNTCLLPQYVKHK